MADLGCSAFVLSAAALGNVNPQALFDFALAKVGAAASPSLRRQLDAAGASGS